MIREYEEKRVPPRSVVMGIPATACRTAREEERADLCAHAENDVGHRDTERAEAEGSW